MPLAAADATVAAVDHRLHPRNWRQNTEPWLKLARTGADIGLWRQGVGVQWERLLDAVEAWQTVGTAAEHANEYFDRRHALQFEAHFLLIAIHMKQLHPELYLPGDPVPPPAEAA